MKPPAPLPRSGSKKGRAAAFCNLPLLLLIGAIQFLVIYSPAIDRYMVMVTKGKPGFPSLLLDGRRGFRLVEEETIPEPRVRCDFADPRSDVCELEGAIRIRGSTSEVFVVAPAGADGLLAANVTGLAPGMNATSWTIQPYTRKGEARVMRSIATLTVRVVAPGDAPPCTVRHDVPAVVYSNGGYCGNYYHDFNDNIIPLFVTARHLGGEVQLLVAQKQAWWFHKYREIVDGLTNYEAVDLGGGDGGGDGEEVRCFRRATLGLHSHKDLSIDPRRAPRNLSMVDFKRFLMWRYALPREHAIRLEEEEAAGAARRRPRLLVVTRRSRRRFVNLPEIVALAEEVGFDVTASDLMSASSATASAKNKAAGGVGDEGHSRMADASKLVNSFDAMVAVHGSGLTNLVFLPMNAVVVQVVPLGRMEGLAMDEYGVPPRDMNMRYLQYNITAEESTLSEVYPRAHPVLLDPMPIHEQSWSLVKDVYLGKQDVRLGVRRFRPVLLKAIQLLR